MKINWFNPNNLEKNLKATIHKTGKLGFTVDAAKKLKLDINKSASIGINEEDPEDKNLYVAIIEGRAANAFTISKAGAYYYINTKTLFDNLKINYLGEPVVYDISEEIIDNNTIYKFKRREKVKKDVLGGYKLG